jgi:hypothetical protein
MARQNMLGSRPMTAAERQRLRRLRKKIAAGPKAPEVSPAEKLEALLAEIGAAKPAVADRPAARTTP